MSKDAIMFFIQLVCLTLLFVFNMQKQRKIDGQKELIELQEELIDLQERRIEQLEAVCP